MEKDDLENCSVHTNQGTGMGLAQGRETFGTKNDQSCEEEYNEEMLEEEVEDIKSMESD